MKTYRPQPTIMEKARNLGVTFQHPFCMVYLFTPEGTKRYCGSLNNIQEQTKDWGICHGMVHFYQRMGMSKEWMLFGGKLDNIRNGFRLERVRSGKDDYLPYWYEGEKPKRATWVLYDVLGRRVVGSWRRLPSRFLKQLAKYQEGHPRKPLRGGL